MFYLIFAKRRKLIYLSSLFFQFEMDDFLIGNLSTGDFFGDTYVNQVLEFNCAKDSELCTFLYFLQVFVRVDVLLLWILEHLCLLVQLSVFLSF